MVSLCILVHMAVFPAAWAQAQQPASRPPMTQEQVQATVRDLEQKLVPMGMDIQNILNLGDVNQFEKVFSRMVFAQEVMKGINFGDELSPELSKTLGDAANLGIVFYQWDRLARFRFLHIRAVHNRLGLFMRCVHANGSVSYFTFFLAESGDGDGLRVVDVYTHRAAMARSTVARHFMAHMGVSQGWLRPESVQIDLMPLDLRRFTEMSTALKNNNFPAANSIYDSMSEQARNQPYIIMVHMAANLENEQLFKADFTKMNEIAPKEIAQDLMLTDQLTSLGRWDEAIAALKVLDDKVGGDPFLTLKIARCEYEKGEKTAAGQSALKAIKSEPDLHAAYMLLLDIEVDKKNYEGAYKMLRLLADKFGLIIGAEEFDKTEDYAEFRKSEFFTQWKEYAVQKQSELKNSTGAK